MTDTHGNTPGGPVPPTSGDEHAQHAAQTGQQPYYQQSYQQPYQAQHTPGQVTVEKKSHGLRTFLLAFAGAALACVIGLGGFGIWQAATGADKGGGSDSGSSTQLGSQNSGSINATDAESDQTLAEAVAQKALPSVAAIDVYANQSNMGGMYGFGGGSNSGSGSTLTQASLGSGVVLTDDGYIITNYHVIAGGDAYKVTIEGETYDAEVVGSDPSSDIAVIKAKDASGLKAIEIGNSDDLIIGEWVMTIGSPFGLEQSVATGIVSATSRSQIMDSSTDQYGQSSGETTIYPNMIQTDAAINPGNSGGPTFNAAGQVIGINSSIASTATSSDSAGSIGIGFAIPSNLVKRVADEIIKDGKVKHVALGVVIKSDTVEADGVTRGGATITKSSATGSAVVSGGPADKAGLKEGDTIVAFNGNAVNNNYSLLGYVRAAALGDKVTLTIVRDGKTMNVDVTLDQEESSVNGSSGSDSNGNSQNNQNNQNGNGQNGYGNGNGNSDGGTGDGGGFSDPFGLW